MIRGYFTRRERRRCFVLRFQSTAIRVAFGDQLKTARLFVSTYDPSIDKTVEQAVRARKAAGLQL